MLFRSVGVDHRVVKVVQGLLELQEDVGVDQLVVKVWLVAWCFRLCFRYRRPGRVTTSLSLWLRL